MSDDTLMLIFNIVYMFIGGAVLFVLGMALLLPFGWFFILNYFFGFYPGDEDVRLHAALATGAYSLAFLYWFFFLRSSQINFSNLLDTLFGWMFAGKHYGKHVATIDSKQAAKEFGQLMQAQLFDDARAAQLFPYMSRFKQRMWRVKYEKRAEEARRLNELVRAQYDATGADTNLADSLLEREMARVRRR